MDAGECPDSQGYGLGPYTYLCRSQLLPLPVVTVVAPSTGPEVGGTSVTITGSGFTYATAVHFGTRPAHAMTIKSDTEITVTSPPGIGTASVTVINPRGPSNDSSTAQFLYLPKSTAPVPPLPPHTESADGGISAAITDSDFTDTTDASFRPTSTLTAAQGTIDAAEAVKRASTATCSRPDRSSHLPRRLEANPGTLPQVWMAYITAWIAGVQGSSYRPGVYCFYSNPAAQISGAVTQPIPMWIWHPANSGSVTVDANSEIAPDPGTSGFPGAIAWQYKESQGDKIVVSMTWTDATGNPRTFTPVDMDTSTVPDPSNPTATVTPVVTGVTPASGPEAGGTSVTITGSGFDASSYVSFGSAIAAATVDSASQITATSPAAATPVGTGTVPVTVTAPGGTSADSPDAQFTYLPPPVVTGLAPAGGLAEGGASVTITGSNFTGATAVRFGSADATVTTVDSQSQITATSPAGTGTVYVTVTTPGGTSPTSADAQFTYLAVTGVTPDGGPEAGGTSVTITGSGFAYGTAAVSFGSDTAVDETVDSESQITATSPGGSGTVPVTVTTSAGTSADLPDAQFTYFPVPAVTGVVPASGLAAGGTSVTITGSDLTGATAVRFGSADATGTTVDSESQITVTSPAGSGAVPVTVTTPGGTSADGPDAQFSYFPVPAVTGLVPASGPEAGGTIVTITGSGFAGATAVRFGSADATGMTVDSERQITVTSPAGSGAGYVTVTTPSGTSADAPESEYTYVPPPEITGIDPGSGPEEGGTSVTITGLNFLPSDDVVLWFRIDDQDIQAVHTVDSESQITATTPGGSGLATVTVSTPGGNASAGFAYTDDSPFDDNPHDDSYDDNPHDDSYDDNPHDDSYDDSPFDDSYDDTPPDDSDSSERE